MYKQIISIIVKVNIIFSDTKNIFLSVYRKIDTALKSFFLLKKNVFFLHRQRHRGVQNKIQHFTVWYSNASPFSFSTLRQLQREFNVKI